MKTHKLPLNTVPNENTQVAFEHVPNENTQVATLFMVQK
jgi:hypothetical protein